MVSSSFILLLGISLAGGMESGIIGGKDVKPHSRPYMASIQYKKHHICGGMLIREDYVLTAGHCLNHNVYPVQNHTEVVLGAHNINKVEKSQQRIPVMKFIQHPLFEQSNEQDYSYDIMLLKLKKKAKLNKFVKVMPLPKKNGKTPANVKCSIAGWGSKTPKGNQASDVMQEVKLKLQFSFECKNKWQQFFNSERMICSVSDGKHAFCMGDSGSPLICNTKPQGIASYTTSDYNRCKGDVYNLNKVVGTYSCRRRTNQWPQMLFFNMVDILAYNAYVIFTAVDPSWNQAKLFRRRLFLEELGNSWSLQQY